jgi:O-antigen ligase
MMIRTERWIDLRSIALFGFFMVLGAAVMLYPLPAVVLVLTIGAFGLVLRIVHANHLKLWQTMALAALTGYMVLNYGFENISLHVGKFPIILGHSLMFAALGLAVLRYRHAVRRALAEPAMILMLVLIVFTCVHLAFDLPQYGLWALRDASLTFEGIFMLLGLLWASDRGNTDLLMKWLFFVIILNLIYSFSFSWRETLQGLSPVSGVFQPIPILGNYHGTDPRLMLGAIFCLSLGSYFVKRRWLLFLLAAVQLFELAIFQVRAMYLAIPLILALLLFFGEIRKFAQFALVLSLGVVGLLLVTSVVGVRMEGRIGSVDLSFIGEHAESLLGKSTAPAEGSVEGRKDWYAQVFKRIRSSTSNLLVGEGFGQPLIQYRATSSMISKDAADVRQPHNSHLTFLARLGLLGVTVWAILNLYIISRFISVLRRRNGGDRKLHELILWLFFYYIIATIQASVQPGFEFSAGAIPFYFLTGVSLGIIRWQVRSPTQARQHIAIPSYALAR